MVGLSSMFSKYFKTAILGILDSVSNNSFFENKIFINHMLFIFKLYIYKFRKKKFININNLIAEIRKVKRIKQEIALSNSMKAIAFRKKWHLTDNNFSNVNGLCTRDFDEKTGRLHVKNGVGLFFMFCFCFALTLWVSFRVFVVAFIVCFVFAVLSFFWVFTLSNLYLNFSLV